MPTHRPVLTSILGLSAAMLFAGCATDQHPIALSVLTPQPVATQPVATQPATQPAVSPQPETQTPPAAKPAAPKPSYLSPETIQAVADAFVQPYMNDGKVTPIATASNDFERLINKQLIAALSPSILAAATADAKTDEKESLWEFRRALGPKFSAENCTNIKAFIDVAFSDAKKINTAAKKQFSRPRPFEEDPEHPKSNPSFPSGHSSTAGLRYRLLAAITEASPDTEIELCKQAWFMCLERLAVNVHYPSDVAAGFVLGEQVAAEVLKVAAADPTSQAAIALEAAKAEWKALK